MIERSFQDHISLRKVVLIKTGEDTRRCRGCSLCNEHYDEEMDIPLSSLIQLVTMNDVEVLTCRTLWSDPVLQASREACTRELNLSRILLALREEAIRRGLK
jgi:heterodisulfide reductase subunit C